jgi:glycosyltransferase involved in cell wall biosynthesis
MNLIDASLIYGGRQPDAFTLFNYTEKSDDQVTGIVFSIIHYNRVASLAEVIDSVLDQAKAGDCLLLIDNGSAKEAQACAKEILANAAQKLKAKIRVTFISARKNRGGIAAYSWLLSYVLGGDFRHATHLVLLGDDDLLLPGWRIQVNEYLAFNDWVAWGFDYFNWISREIEESGSHSGRIQCISGELAHREWLGSIAGMMPSHGRQEHSSAVAVSLQSLRLANQSLATIIPMPYGDVGFALVVAYADSLVYIDKSLGLIGRGTNYGMGSAERMAANHPTRGRIAGRPSHSKYLAATYVECLLLLGREDLIEGVTKGLIWLHLVTTYGITFKSAFGAICRGSSQDLFSKFSLTFEDVKFLLALRLYSLWPWCSDRLVLRMLGFTRLFSFHSKARIKDDFIKKLVCRS